MKPRSWGCVPGGCRRRMRLGEWCRHCGGRVRRIPCVSGALPYLYVHAGSCVVECAEGGGLAEPGGARPGDGAALGSLRARLRGRWAVHVLALGYIAVPVAGRDPGRRPVWGQTVDEVAWEIRAAEAAS